MHILIACRPWAPTAALGGTEQAILHLAGALTAAGARVSLAGPTPDAAPDLAIAVNDARLLPPRAARQALWLHNEVTFRRELRRRRLPALLRHRPDAVFLSEGQRRAASRLLPFRRRLVIPHGLGAAYLAETAPRPPPPPLALFTSQPYRGLAELLDLWRTAIAPAVPQARLEARIAAAHLAEFAAPPGATLAPRLPNAEMPALLRTARVLLAPGHVSETFCLAAAEAIALGVPVVTRGWGALAERVVHGKTGFVCRSWPDFAAHTRAVLAEDALWASLHAQCLAAPRLSWAGSATLWLAAFPA